jgi:hypothetical protein
MAKRYLTFSEETNALDYLERAALFVREAASDDRAWKWVIIALHGALYGFAVCACKGTNFHNITYQTKTGRRKLISFQDALATCQDPQKMMMTVLSRPLVLTADQQVSIDKLQQSLRNPFEHFIPTTWHIGIHGMPSIAIHCLEVIRFLALETGNYTNLAREQNEHVEKLVCDTTSFLQSMPLHQEYLRVEQRTITAQRHERLTPCMNKK